LRTHYCTSLIYYTRIILHLSWYIIYNIYIYIIYKTQQRQHYYWLCAHIVNKFSKEIIKTEDILKMRAKNCQFCHIRTCEGTVSTGLRYYTTPTILIGHQKRVKYNMVWISYWEWHARKNINYIDTCRCIEEEEKGIIYTPIGTWSTKSQGKEDDLPLMHSAFTTHKHL